MNRPILRLYGFVVAAVRAARRASPRAGRSSKPPRCARTSSTRARCSSSSASTAARSSPPTARCSRAACAAQAKGSTNAPTRRAASSRNAIGYYFTNLGSTGLERFRNAPLSGQNVGNLQSVLDQLQGKRQRGEKVVTTLDPRAQQVANAALGGHKGAVVALEPRSGAVTVMASSPGYDPNSLRSTATAASIKSDPTGRADQPRHAVRLRARLDLQGRDRDGRDRHRRLHARIDGQRAQRHPDLRRAAAERRQRELRADHADRSAREIGQHRLGAGRRTRRQGARSRRYMQRFGFDRKPQLDYPATEMSSSGEYRRRTAASRPRARASTSGAWASARTNSPSRRCRWPRSRPPSPTAAR